MPTNAPAPPSASATARPMPTPAPVTSATRPRRSNAPASVIVAPRVLGVPVPRRLDDRPKFGVARLPAQFLLNLCRRRHQRRRVARAARPFLDRHLLAAHLLDGADHLAHAVAAAG